MLRMQAKRVYQLALTCFALAAVSPLYATPTELPATVAAALLRAEIPSSAVAIIVQDASQTVPVLTINAERAMNPASVMKLLTTYVALVRTGSSMERGTEPKAA